MNNKVKAIYNAYNNHEKGYIVSIEDILSYLTSQGYNWALWSGWKLMWNKLKDWSYLEIDNIELWVMMENQKKEVIDWFFKLIKWKKTET